MAKHERRRARDVSRSPASDGFAQAERDESQESEAEYRFAVFDLETESWDRFVLAGLLTSEGRYLESRDEEAFFEAIEALGKDCEIYAWNGGRYDFLWALEWGRKLGRQAEIGLAGSRVTTIKWAGGQRWKDAVALIPMSLSRAASIAGIKVAKNTGLTCRCGSACGGYCAIKRRMPEADYRKLGSYLRKDCEAALAIIKAARAEADRSGYIVKNTIGSSAWATAAAMCDLESAAWEPAHYRLARSGYYGGRVEVFRPKAPLVYGCDLNSAYPAALALTALPCGESIVIAKARAERAFARGREGIYGADVIVPQSFIPPLPARVGDRVVFPVGRIDRGRWTRIELEYAIGLGARVIRWGPAIVWDDATPLLRPFVLAAWARRAEAMAAGNDGLKQWHKLVANSLTGKLAQAPELERVILNLPSDKLRLCPGGDCGESARACRASRKPWSACCSHHCSGRCKRHRALDMEGKIWASSFFRMPESGHVHWAAYLTAATRIELHRQLTNDGGGSGGADAVYCDTDSVRSTVPRTRRLGTDLGEWGDEGALPDWEALAPKTYRHGKPSGGVAIKAKGLPDMDDRAWADFAAGRPVVRERGVKSLKEAARGESLFARRHLSRAGHFDLVWFGGRKIGDDGRTYPTTIQEFEAAHGIDDE